MREQAVRMSLTGCVNGGVAFYNCRDMNNFGLIQSEDEHRNLSCLLTNTQRTLPYTPKGRRAAEEAALPVRRGKSRPTWQQHDYDDKYTLVLFHRWLEGKRRRGTDEPQESAILIAARKRSSCSLPGFPRAAAGLASATAFL